VGENRRQSFNFYRKTFEVYSRVKTQLLKIYEIGIGVNVNDEYLNKLKSFVELAKNKVKLEHVLLPIEDRHVSTSLKGGRVIL